MSSASVVLCLVAAALLFWIVGAYHRLTRLRSDVVRQFAPVGAAVGTRQTLLQRQIDALAPVLASAGPRLDALRAACRQTEAALIHAQARPARREPIASLRLAEQILADARGRLPVQGAPGPELAALHGELGAIDAAIVFARSQFNAAVAAYNTAARQFPTLFVAGLFGLRPAAPL